MQNHHNLINKEKPQAQRRHPKWRNKWWKAITLYNNPSLTLDLMKQELKQSKKMDAEARVRHIFS